MSHKLSLGAKHVDLSGQTLMQYKLLLFDPSIGIIVGPMYLDYCFSLTKLVFSFKLKPVNNEMIQPFAFKYTLMEAESMVWQPLATFNHSLKN